MRNDHVPPDSKRIRLALLPARIRHWRKCGCHELADKLEAELAAATGAQIPTDHPDEPAEA